MLSGSVRKLSTWIPKKGEEEKNQGKEVLDDYEYYFDGIQTVQNNPHIFTGGIGHLPCNMSKRMAQALKEVAKTNRRAVRAKLEAEKAAHKCYQLFDSALFTGGGGSQDDPTAVEDQTTLQQDKEGTEDEQSEQSSQHGLDNAPPIMLDLPKKKKQRIADMPSFRSLLYEMDTDVKQDINSKCNFKTEGEIEGDLFRFFMAMRGKDLEWWSGKHGIACYGNKAQKAQRIIAKLNLFKSD